MRRKPQQPQQSTDKQLFSVEATPAETAGVRTYPTPKRRIPGQDFFEYLETIEQEDWGKVYLYLSRQGSGHVKGSIRLEDFKRAITYKELSEEILPQYGPGTYILQLTSKCGHVQSTREVVSWDNPAPPNSQGLGVTVARGTQQQGSGSEPKLPEQLKQVASTVKELREMFPQQSESPMMAFLLDRLTKAEERNHELMLKLIEQKETAASSEDAGDPLSMLDMMDALDQRMEARMNRHKADPAPGEEHPAVTIGKYAAPFLAAMVAPHINKVMSWATAGQQVTQPTATTPVKSANGQALQEPKFTPAASTDPNQAVIELVANLKEVFRRGEHTDENAPNFWSAYIQRLLPQIAQWIAHRKPEDTMQTLMSIDQTGEFSQLLQQEEIREFVQSTIEKVKEELTAN